MSFRQHQKQKWTSVNKKYGKRRSNYPSFDKFLDIHFAYDTPTNRDALSNKMQEYGFHIKDNRKEPPTDKQLCHAWDYILIKYLPKQKEITDYYSTETFGISHKTKRVNYRYRASKNIEYKGKKYRKGQFLPSQRMLD
jgi:hypothetical protein